MKILFIIIDGLGDKPIPQLKNKTPLEAAFTPNLDSLVKRGICGLIEPFFFPWQKNPRSDTAHLALFGYNPRVYYSGRGLYEAVGVGMKMQKGDVALRTNFGTVNKNQKIIDRRAGRISDTKPLVRALSGITINGVKFLISDSLGHRAVLILRGKNISEKIGGGDIKKIGIKPQKIISLERSKEAEFTAKVLNQFLEKAHQILVRHPLNKKRKKQKLLPANYLLVRGPGKLKKTPNFYQKYKLRAACIAAGHVYKGVAKVLGMDLVKVKGATGNIDTNLKSKFSAVKRNFKKHDFIFCHIKATDILSEDGNFLGKKKFIEKIDKHIKSLIELRNTLIVVTADHSTCSQLKRHCETAIPVLIYGNGQDSVEKFSERACRRGKLGKVKQIHLMSKILKLAKK